MIAISLALTSVLMVALLIVALFVHYLAAINLRQLVILFFVLSLTSLVASLVLFIKDMTLSLQALREELRDHL